MNTVVTITFIFVNEKDGAVLWMRITTAALHNEKNLYKVSKAHELDKAWRYPRGLKRTRQRFALSITNLCIHGNLYVFPGRAIYSIIEKFLFRFYAFIRRQFGSHIDTEIFFSCRHILLTIGLS